MGTNGGDLAYQKNAPTRERADKLLNDRLAAPFRGDANDVLYQWDSSRDYNPSPGLERIEAALLAINAADDERNPPETGIMERELKRVKNGKLFLDSRQREHRGPRHHRLGAPLHAGAARVPAKCAQARDVTPARAAATSYLRTIGSLTASPNTRYMPPREVPS